MPASGLGAPVAVLAGPIPIGAGAELAAPGAVVGCELADGWFDPGMPASGLGAPVGVVAGPIPIGAGPGAIEAAGAAPGPAPVWMRFSSARFN
jgi:hypothetical protein